MKGGFKRIPQVGQQFFSGDDGQLQVVGFQPVTPDEDISLNLNLSSYPKPAKKRRSIPATLSKSLPTTPMPNFADHFVVDSNGQLQLDGSQPLASNEDISLSSYNWSVSPATKSLMVHSPSLSPGNDLSLELKPFIINAAGQAKVWRVVPPETYIFTFHGELICPNQLEKGEKLDTTGDNVAAGQAKVGPGVPPETYSFTFHGELIDPNQLEKGEKLDTAGDNDAAEKLDHAGDDDDGDAMSSKE